MNFSQPKKLACLVIACILTARVVHSHFSLSTDAIKVTDFYSGVQDWANFSPRTDISLECASDDSLQVAYVTQHERSTWDFVSLATSVDATWTILNPSLFYPAFWDDKQDYNDLKTAARIWNAIGQMYCRMGDVLMFSNINDARPLLQGGCTTPTIIQAGDRFMDGVRESDVKVYEELIAKTLAWPHVWWVMNNAYEEKYFEWRKFHLPKNRTVILRPFGVSLLPRPSQPEDRTTKVALIQNDYNASLDSKVLIPWIQENLGSYVDVLSQGYGGPYKLADYRAVVHVPYQASATTMYEGLAAGAVFVLPSPSFLKQLLQQNEKAAFCCRELLDVYPDTFSEYMDWYHADVRDCHVYFDSFNELVQIAKGEDKYTWELFQEKKACGAQAMQRIRVQTLAGYRQLLKDVKLRACEENLQPDEFSLGMGQPTYRVYSGTNNSIENSTNNSTN